MSTAARPATPPLPRHGATLAQIEADASDVRLRIRQARVVCSKITPVGDEDSLPERAAKGMLYSDRFKGLEHQFAIFYDLIDRGIPLQHLDAVLELITAKLHAYAERRRGLRSDNPSLAYVNADVATELTQGVCAFARAVAEPCAANLHRAEIELAEAEETARRGREYITRRAFS